MAPDGKPEIRPTASASAAAGGSLKSFKILLNLASAPFKQPLSIIRFDITKNGKIDGINVVISEIMELYAASTVFFEKMMIKNAKIKINTIKQYDFRLFFIVRFLSKSFLKYMQKVIILSAPKYKFIGDDSEKG